jgi:hypothetical protein
MTEFMNQARLHEIARVTDHPPPASGRLIPSLAWTVDAETGRPVGQWGLTEKHDAPSTRV